MSDFKLRPMPELFLVDPISGELPKNYKQLLAQQRKQNTTNNNSTVNGENKQDSEETKCKSQFKLKPMPELFLIDPVTGVLPKNYKDILAKQRKRDTPNEGGDQPSSKKKKKSFELKPMPEIALIDPVTGELPKNYKQILAQQRNSNAPSNSTENKFQFPKPTAAATKPKLNNLQFKVSKVTAKENIPKKMIPDSSGQTNTKSKGVRKVLFRDTDTRTSRLRGIMGTRVSQLQKKASSTEISDTSLLDMEQCGAELLLLEKKPKRATRIPALPSNAPMPKRIQSAEKRSLRSSSSSTEEFLRLEQECKTPKSIIKAKQRNSLNHLKHVDNITRKISEINTLHTEIEKRNKEIIEKNKKIENNWKDIKHSLNLIGGALPININFNSTENKENSQSQHSESSINSITNEVTLRISSLNKNLQRKVLFNLNENEASNSSKIIKTAQSNFKGSETPNTVIRTMRKIADEQYLQLRDTPKALP